MNSKKIIYDNYLSVAWCSWCREEIKFNTVCYRVSFFIRRAKKKSSPANKKIVKYYHESCFSRVNQVVSRRAGRARNPMGRYGAKSGG